MIELPATTATCARPLRAARSRIAALIGVVALSTAAQAATGDRPTPPATAPAAATTAPATAATPPAAAPAEPANSAAAQHQADIDSARARCTALLKSITAVAIAKDPIEEGDCGTLAPIELVSVGKNPEVALSPPAIVNCDMAVAIHDWMKSDVQPLARKHLGKVVVRLETMSSYSCRNAYGRKMSKLSEHGRANALDIRGFVTASGQTAYVLEGWGMTSSEIRAAAVAAEKEQAARELAAKAEAEARTQALAAASRVTPAANGTKQSAPNPIANAATIVDGLPKSGLTFGTNLPKASGSDLALTQPNKLGGPKKGGPTIIAAAPQAATPPDANSATATSLFLRAVHDTACHRFGTTLGPETNAAHRNHLHIDLAERKLKPICE